MAVGIGGLGLQAATSPQVFHGLSLAGQSPSPPVPTGRAAPVPGNLSLAAHSPFSAILKIGSQGTVSFTLTDGSAAVASGLATILPVAAPHSVAKIVTTIKNLAVAAVYPASVFAFHA